MSILMDMTKAFMDSKGFRYTAEEGKSYIRTGLGGLSNKGSVDIILDYSYEGSVSIRAYNICKVPEEKKAAVYEKCSDLNAAYRWVKFYVDESDNTITAADDAVLVPESAGAEVYELINRLAGIVDRGYPELMKVLWS